MPEMTIFFEKLIHFFNENLPTISELFRFGIPFLLIATAALHFSGFLKKRYGWKTGYSRKSFHFIIFFLAATLHHFYGLRMVCLFGLMTSAVLLFAILRGDGNIFFEALAREKDEPHRTYFIIIPYMATLIGGVLSNVFFEDMAIAGYLVAGMADAIAEPVGTRFGKHRYRVPGWNAVGAYRSYEGSLSVFLVSFAVLIAFVSLKIMIPLSPPIIFSMFIISLICTLAEAVSPHGWDNLIMQLLPAALMSVFLNG